MASPATTLIREHEAAEGRDRTPVVALTASNMKGDREHFLEAGMDGHLAKPFSAEALYEVVRTAARSGKG